MTAMTDREQAAGIMQHLLQAFSAVATMTPVQALYFVEFAREYCKPPLDAFEHLEATYLKALTALIWERSQRPRSKFRPT